MFILYFFNILYYFQSLESECEDDELLFLCFFDFFFYLSLLEEEEEDLCFRCFFFFLLWRLKFLKSNITWSRILIFYCIGMFLQNDQQHHINNMHHLFFLLLLFQQLNSFHCNLINSFISLLLMPLLNLNKPKIR